MHIDIGPLQGKPWHEQLSVLVKEADRIARDYQNPLVNDAGGTIDCYQIGDKLNDCIRILSKYKKGK